MVILESNSYSILNLGNCNGVNTLMLKQHEILFQPINIGPRTLKNRFYQVPHCTGMGYNLPQTHAAMRSVKAEGGWGAVCTEYCSISPDTDDAPYPFQTIWDDSDVKNLSMMVSGVHEHNSLAGIELLAGGSYVANMNVRRPALGAVSLQSASEPLQSRAMDKSDIVDLRRTHKLAVKRAIQAGFDIIYVYATHGYLFTEFLSPKVNIRTDEYGGTALNRSRIIREIIEDSLEEIKGQAALAVRFSANGDDMPMEERNEIFSAMCDLPDLWDLNIDSYHEEMSPSQFLNSGTLANQVSWVKNYTKKPVLTVGRYTSPDDMASHIRSGHIDIIGAARPSIADPFLPNKIRDEDFDEIRECIGCNICYATNTRGVPMRCTQNPTMGEEWRKGWHPEKLPQAKSEGSILVVGGGPSGLEATASLAKRGYNVTLAEKSNELGGRILSESKLLGLNEWIRVRDYRLSSINKSSNVEVFLNSEMQLEDLLDFGADKIIISTGSTWNIDGRGNTLVGGGNYSEDSLISVDEFFKNRSQFKSSVSGRKILIYDDNGHYMAPTIAIDLATAGAVVTLVCSFGYANEWGLNTEERVGVNQKIAETGIKLITSHSVSAFNKNKATISCVFSGFEKILETDLFMPVTIRTPNSNLYHALKNLEGNDSRLVNKSIYRIGDCEAPGLIANCIYSGHKLAREIDSSDEDGVYLNRERVSI